MAEGYDQEMTQGWLARPPWSSSQGKDYDEANALSFGGIPNLPYWLFSK
jgi:hypothetical protein